MSILKDEFHPSPPGEFVVWITTGQVGDLCAK